MDCKIPETVEQGFDSYVEYEERVFNEFNLMKKRMLEKFSYNGKCLRFRYIPVVRNKPEVFWHITSTKNHKNERLPDLDRYKKVRWAEYVLLDCFMYNHDCNYSWIRSSKNRIHIMCLSIDYIVVLEERDEYILFITAYPITRKHTRTKLIKDYEKSLTITYSQ